MNSSHKEKMTILRTNQEEMRAAVSTIMFGQGHHMEFGPCEPGDKVGAQIATVRRRSLDKARGSEEMLEEALSLVLHLDAAKAATRPPVRLCVAWAGVPSGPLLAGTDCSRTGQPICLQCGSMSHLKRDR